jgi:hypothetical protein
VSDGEDEKERLNRKLEELLQELRVALPGVQVLFAFLLTMPFTGQFPKEDTLQRGTYFTAFMFAALASAFLIAPSAYHRLRWKLSEKESLEVKRNMLMTAGWQAMVGLVFLGLAITAVVFLITDVMFGVPQAAAVTGALFVVFAWLWYVLPLSRRLRDR